MTGKVPRNTRVMRIKILIQNGKIRGVNQIATLVAGV